MCGRYTNTLGPEELAKQFGVEIPSSEGTRRYNVAPTEQVLAIVAPEREPQARLLRWGLTPHWAIDTKDAPKMINARLETLTSRRAYRTLIGKASRRALQIADGYYEWLKPEHRSQPRQPFHFQLDTGMPFAFAALWTLAKIDGEWLPSITLITCDSAPNRLAAAIHDRMPVILADPPAQRAWLDPTVGVQEALELCRALPATRMSARPANPAVGNVNSPEGPQLLVATT